MYCQKKYRDFYSGIRCNATKNPKDTRSVCWRAHSVHMIMDSDLSVLCVRETVFLHLQDGIAFSQIVLFCWNQPWSRSGCHLHKNGKCCTYKRFDLAMQKDWALSYLITPKILVENELTFLPELSQRSPFVLFCFIHPSWIFFQQLNQLTAPSCCHTCFGHLEHKDRRRPHMSEQLPHLSTKWLVWRSP